MAEKFAKQMFDALEVASAPSRKNLEALRKREQRSGNATNAEKLKKQQLKLRSRANKGRAKGLRGVLHGELVRKGY